MVAKSPAKRGGKSPAKPAPVIGKSPAKTTTSPLASPTTSQRASRGQPKSEPTDAAAVVTSATLKSPVKRGLKFGAPAADAEAPAITSPRGTPRRGAAEAASKAMAAAAKADAKGGTTTTKDDDSDAFDVAAEDAEEEEDAFNDSPPKKGARAKNTTPRKPAMPRRYATPLIHRPHPIPPSPSLSFGFPPSNHETDLT